MQASVIQFHEKLVFNCTRFELENFSKWNSMAPCFGYSFCTTKNSFIIDKDNNMK